MLLVSLAFIQIFCLDLLNVDHSLVADTVFHSNRNLTCSKHLNILEGYAISNKHYMNHLT